MENGTKPFSEWIEGLAGEKAFGIILTRIERVAKGNFGDYGSVGQGVSELRVDFGPGYRVYFGEDGDVIILLGGGSKKTQSADIARAKDNWRDYNA